MSVSAGAGAGALTYPSINKPKCKPHLIHKSCDSGTLLAANKVMMTDTIECHPLIPRPGSLRVNDVCPPLRCFLRDSCPRPRLWLRSTCDTICTYRKQRPRRRRNDNLVMAPHPETKSPTAARLRRATARMSTVLLRLLQMAVTAPRSPPLLRSSMPLPPW